MSNFDKFKDMKVEKTSDSTQLDCKEDNTIYVPQEYMDGVLLRLKRSFIFHSDIWAKHDMMYHKDAAEGIRFIINAFQNPDIGLTLEEQLKIKIEYDMKKDAFDQRKKDKGLVKDLK